MTMIFGRSNASSVPRGCPGALFQDNDIKQIKPSSEQAMFRIALDGTSDVVDINAYGKDVEAGYKTSPRISRMVSMDLTHEKKTLIPASFGKDPSVARSPSSVRYTDIANQIGI